MYDKTNDQPALANSSDLNEELGQVEFLFTDKIGTLTENLMVFRRCSVNGNVYIEKDCDGNLYLLPSSGNKQEAVKLSTKKAEIWHFVISLSLCHIVQIAPPRQRPEIIARRTLFREKFRLKKITRVNSSLMTHPDLPQYQIWVLTGDKAETAENIAFLCGHFKKGTEVLRLMDQTSVQTCFLVLTSFEQKIKLEPYISTG
ncbi:phospholipid-transporting ATPase IH-like [Temnothorax americanus]|uniref:phospholipid-transporting ATPase IH-like n=1 Tax=Temnothorax americanus TaxID=1964332 RepID=UPI004067FC13